MEVVARELKAHLRRLAVWSCFSLVAGGVLLGMQQGSAGVMTASWAVINLIIVALSWKGKPPASYQKFREFLAFNQGLNLMYIAVGLTLGLAAGPADVRASGWAVVPQGLALLILDGILMARTSTPPAESTG